MPGGPWGGNGGTLARTFVSELGSRVGFYQCRATCTRCIPRWFGPVRSNLDAVMASGGALEPAAAVDRARAWAIEDVLAHVDRLHGGKLSR